MLIGAEWFLRLDHTMGKDSDAANFVWPNDPMSSNSQPKKNFTLGRSPRFPDAPPWLKSDRPIKESPIR